MPAAQRDDKRGGVRPQWTVYLGTLMTDTAFPAIAAAIKTTLESQGFTRLVGATVVAVEPGVVVMALNRRDEVLQQNGLFHGGVIAYLIDNTSTAAAATVIARAERSVLTAEYKLNFVAPSKGDRLTCRAEGEEKLVAVALATIAHVDRLKG